MSDFLHYVFPGLPEKKEKQLAREIVATLKGGEGSGNFGHAGRPGEVGGSAGDGASSKWTDINGIVYHGDTGATGALMGGTTKLEDIPGFYVTPNRRTAERLSEGKEVSQFKLSDDIKVATYNDLRPVFKNNPYKLIGTREKLSFGDNIYIDPETGERFGESDANPKAYYQFIADGARQLGYDAIFRGGESYGGIDELIILNPNVLVSAANKELP